VIKTGICPNQIDEKGIGKVRKGSVAGGEYQKSSTGKEAQELKNLTKKGLLI